MRRWLAGTNTPCATSVSTWSLSWTNADLAWRSPATRSSREVLPAPDGPKMAVMRPCISTSTSSVNGASGREMFLRSRLTSAFSAAYQPFAPPHRCKRKHHRHAEQTEGVGVLAELHRLENGE